MYVDAHNHLDCYDENLLIRALEEIENYNIYTISNSMDISSYERNKEISKESEFVIPAFGIHPWNAGRYLENLEEILPYIEDSPIIGEIGLDFSKASEEAKLAQRKVLDFILEKSKDMDKFVNIHTKGCEEEIFDTLIKHECKRVIVHWYSGDFTILEKMIKEGYFFTINSEVIKNNSIREIANRIPLDKILVETDGPSGEGTFKDKLAMPVDVISTTRELARIKNIKEEVMKSIVINNFQGILRD
ncbi:TatD family hydrolase [Clostridium hydrogeniformans]|uniref:TatD family hydrolase n=1 Tax=Clostridium hydrogeniformans TaxID=349933 RepID=UPI0004892DE9|nr:TatD family hydrolase [Clostridium hydrogeniformans]